MVHSSRSLHHRNSPPYPIHSALGLWAAALTVPSTGDWGLNHHIQEIQLLPVKDSPPIPCSPSLLFCPSFIVLPLSPWWLLFVTWGKQKLAFCFISTQQLNLQQIRGKISTPHNIFGISEKFRYFLSFRLPLQNNLVWATSYIMSISLSAEC